MSEEQQSSRPSDEDLAKKNIRLALLLAMIALAVYLGFMFSYA